MRIFISWIPRFSPGTSASSHINDPFALTPVSTSDTNISCWTGISIFVRWVKLLNIQEQVFFLNSTLKGPKNLYQDKIKNVWNLGIWNVFEKLCKKKIIVN